MDISPYCGRVGYLSARTGEIGSIAQSHAAEHFLRGAQMSSLGWLVGSIRRRREDEKIALLTPRRIKSACSPF